MALVWLTATNEETSKTYMVKSRRRNDIEVTLRPTRMAKTRAAECQPPSGMRGSRDARSLKIEGAAMAWLCGTATSGDSSAAAYRAKGGLTA